MAEELSPPSSNEVTRKHNVGARADVIRKARKEIKELEAELEPLIGEAKGVRKQIGNIFRTLKNDLDGMTRKDAQRAFDILDLEDAEDGNTAIDAIREIFNACKKGDIVDFFSVMPEPDQQPKTSVGQAMKAAAEKKKNAKPRKSKKKQ
jgi:hypothetical protein